jgi:hypothetical protein
MKVYSCPAEVPAPTPNYRNYDSAKELAAEKKHQADLAKWLKTMGYKGKHTGGIYSVCVADGKAAYMLADGPTKSILIHLPYGDAYESRDVEFIPKKEIIRRIEAEKKFREIWNRQPVSA